jgi:hypothetical protein
MFMEKFTKLTVENYGILEGKDKAATAVAITITLV